MIILLLARETRWQSGLFINNKLDTDSVCNVLYVLASSTEYERVGSHPAMTQQPPFSIPGIQLVTHSSCTFFFIMHVIMTILLYVFRALFVSWDFLFLEFGLLLARNPPNDRFEFTDRVKREILKKKLVNIFVSDPWFSRYRSLSDENV